MMQGKQFIRGGLSFGYETRMLARLTHRILMWGIGGYLLVVGLILGFTSYHAITTLWLQSYATFLEHTGFGTQEVWHGAHGGFSAQYFLNSPKLQFAVVQAKQTLLHDLFVALVLGCVIYPVMNQCYKQI